MALPDGVLIDKMTELTDLETQLTDENTRYADFIAANQALLTEIAGKKIELQAIIDFVEGQPNN